MKLQVPETVTAGVTRGRGVEGGVPWAAGGTREYTGKAPVDCRSAEAAWRINRSEILLATDWGRPRGFKMT